MQWRKPSILPLLVWSSEVDVPLLDTTRIHALAAVNLALTEGGAAISLLGSVRGNLTWDAESRQGAPVLQPQGSLLCTTVSGDIEASTRDWNILTRGEYPGGDRGNHDSV